MTRDEIFNKIKRILVDQLGVEESKITLSASYTDDLNLDSLDLVDLFMEIQESLDISVSPEEYTQLFNIQKTIDQIEKFLSES